jgi:phosphate starvation-inducible PhoH-like protein
MIQETLSFESQEQIRALFGCQDENLRLLRERLDVQVVVRGEELRLTGADDHVATGVKVFAELQDVVRRHGELFPTEIERILGRHTGESVVFPRLTESEGPSARSRHDGNGRRNGGNGNGSRTGQSEPTDGAPIDLFEKARAVHPRTGGQDRYVEAIRRNDLVFCIGPAGTGKTYLAVAMGLNALRTERVRRIVLVRPAVEAGEKLGFLPGDMQAKVNPYLRPLIDALSDILTYEQVKRYIEHDVIEIAPMAFMRGRTLNDTFIILDEAQNTTATQMQMFLTRMGENSKIVVTGDPTQVDLASHTKSGLPDAIGRLRDIPGVEAVELTGQDIVRHRLVREIVRAYDDDRRHKPRSG